MPHDISLLTTIAGGLGLAFLLGLVATRLQLPPVLAYLVAGVMVGPFTPGFVADVGLASQLAEIGVILLMFGVGLHFSIRDLLEVRRIAVPGAIVQITVATLLGAGVANIWGWSWGTGIVFGLSLSVASTVVLLRALEARGILESVDGRIAVGWLIVEDLVTVLALVLLPPLAGILGSNAVEATAAEGPSVMRILLITAAKMGGFLVVMLVGGRRVVPWVLGRVVNTGSREMFTLAVLSIALGIAVGAAALFDVSFALGAFFAGIIVSESDFSHEAATNALPLQDAFAVLFFVSVGMLFDPAILVRQPLQVLAVVLIILIGKSLAAFGIVRLFGHSHHTALTISASLAQIGEFSFILAALGVSLGLLPPDVQSLVVAGALLSITLNPLVFAAVDPLARRLSSGRAMMEAIARRDEEPKPAPGGDAELTGHVVIIGGGRVGEPVAFELKEIGVPCVVVDASEDVVARMRSRGLTVVHGDATDPAVLASARLDRARLVVVAAPDAYAARTILARSHQLNPGVEVILRTHSDDERRFLEEMGAARALVAERALALALMRETLKRFEHEADVGQMSSRILQTGIFSIHNQP